MSNEFGKTRRTLPWLALSDEANSQDRRSDDKDLFASSSVRCVIYRLDVLPKPPCRYSEQLPFHPDSQQGESSWVRSSREEQRETNTHRGHLPNILLALLDESFHSRTNLEFNFFLFVTVLSIALFFVDGASRTLDDRNRTLATSSGPSACTAWLGSLRYTLRVVFVVFELDLLQTHIQFADLVRKDINYWDESQSVAMPLGVRDFVPPPLDKRLMLLVVTVSLDWSDQYFVCCHREVRYVQRLPTIQSWSAGW